MPVLPILLFLLVILAGSLPAFSRTCCYPAHFEPSPPYDYGCVCIDAYDNVRVEFVYDPSDPFFDYQYSECSAMFASCEDVFLNCRVSDSGVIDCFSSSSSEDNPSFSCSSFPCFLDYIPDFGGSGSGSSSACQSVYNLIDTFKGVKEGFLKVFIGSSFAFGLLGGVYAVLRVRFGP
jgi:hypothetical protein